MEIKRDKYLNKLVSKRNNGLIKVITGIRRCGKSYLLFNLYYEYLIKEGVSEDCIILVLLDDYDYIEYRDTGYYYRLIGVILNIVILKGYQNILKVV